MPPDWLYYLFGFLLVIANAIAWAGNGTRLPGNWVMTANCALYMAFFPAKVNGLSFGWFTVVLLAMMAALADSLAFAVKRKLLFTGPAGRPSRRVLAGAGIGSLLGALLGWMVPVIGSLVAIPGSIGGAASGAYLGTMLGKRKETNNTANNNDMEDDSDSPAPLEQKLPFGWTDDTVRTAVRLFVGALILLLATFGTFAG